MEFSTQVSKQNKTLFAFTNETLSSVSKICAEGGTPSQLYPLWRTISFLRQLDVITLPADFIDDLISRLYALDRETVLKMFRDLGSRLVGPLKIVAEDTEGLSELAKDFSFMLPVKHFQIKRQNQRTIQIDVVGAGRKLESTECTAELIKSILNGYMYTVTKQEITIGTLRLWATRRDEF
jgi:hypothetical protein